MSIEIGGPWRWGPVQGLVTVVAAKLLSPEKLCGDVAAAALSVVAYAGLLSAWGNSEGLLRNLVFFLRKKA